MSKNYFVSLGLIAAFVLSTGLALADEVQSPIYKDDIGRSHFLGRGGYSSVRKLDMQEAQAGIINEAVNEFSNQENTEPNITDVIKEKPVVPAASHKSTYSYEKGAMDASNFYGIGGTNIPAGVNDSKTIYTDDLGRLHFFGKANQIRE